MYELGFDGMGSMPKAFEEVKEGKYHRDDSGLSLITGGEDEEPEESSEGEGEVKFLYTYTYALTSTSIVIGAIEAMQRQYEIPFTFLSC